MSEYATKISAFVRMTLCLSKFTALRQSAILCQSLARMTREHSLYNATLAATVLIQCASRCSASRRLAIFKRRTRAATRIRVIFLTHRDLRAYRLAKDAAVRIQATSRRVAQQLKFKIALKEAQEEKKVGFERVCESQSVIPVTPLTRLSLCSSQLENQLATLQKKLAMEEEKRMKAEQRAKEAEESMGSTPPLPPDGKNRRPADSDEIEEGFVDLGSQQALMHESGKMMEYLRKEVFKLRTHNSQLRTDNERLKENSRRLMDANAAAGAR